jgi:hypothetical protein
MWMKYLTALVISFGFLGSAEAQFSVRIPDYKILGEECYKEGTLRRVLKLWFDQYLVPGHEKVTDKGSYRMGLGLELEDISGVNGSAVYGNLHPESVQDIDLEKLPEKSSRAVRRGLIPNRSRAWIPFVTFECGGSLSGRLFVVLPGWPRL